MSVLLRRKKGKKKKKVREIKQQLPIITVVELKKVIRSNSFDLGIAVRDYLNLAKEFSDKTLTADEAILEVSDRTQRFMDMIGADKFDADSVKTEEVNLYGTTLEPMMTIFDSGVDFMKFQQKLAKAYLLYNYSGFERDGTMLLSQKDSILGLPYRVAIDVSNPNNVRYSMQWEDVDEGEIEAELDKEIEMSFDASDLYAQLTNLWADFKNQRNSLLRSFEDLQKLDGKLQKVDLSKVGDSAKEITKVSYSLSGYLQQVIHMPIYSLHMKQKVAIKKYSDFLAKLIIELKREERKK